MDPPPSSFFPHPTATATASHPDSANSSPRSRPDSTWIDDNLLPPVPGAKLRLMCSYGGHIIPRPHDKSLCYVGGDTRIVVVDRHSSLSDLHSRLSHTLLNGRHFTLKYQLPTEDLDSLISLAADEDLENMIEEYDRTTAASPLKPSRLRLFLFPTKPETAASMGCLLDDAKSETWFVDALNGSGLLPRGLSESAAIDNLVELNRGMANSDSCTDLEAQNESNNNQVSAKSEVVVESPPVVETSSSFGSSSSTPSMANLPPIKVRSEDYLMAGLDEQFSHVSIANFASAAVPYPGVAAVRYGGENQVICEDEKSEKSDHGMVAPSGLRKPPLPLQPVQRKVVDTHNLPSPDSKHAGGYNLPSPDSVASDCSITSVGSQSRQTIYQDPTRVQLQPDPKINTQDPQQQFIQSTHYIQPMYLHRQTQQPDPVYLSQPSYDRPLTPPVYPAKSEMAGSMHHQMGGGSVMVQVVPAQHYIQPHANAGYGYEYTTHHHMQMQDQGYYGHPVMPLPPPQYQTITPASAVMFTQFSPDNNAPQS